MLNDIINLLLITSTVAYVGSTVLRTSAGKHLLRKFGLLSMQTPNIETHNELDAVLIKRLALEMDKCLQRRGRAYLEFSEDGQNATLRQDDRPLSIDDRLNAFIYNYPTVSSFFPGLIPGTVTALGTVLYSAHFSEEIDASEAIQNACAVIYTVGMMLNAYENYNHATKGSLDSSQEIIQKIFIRNNAIARLHQ